MTKLSLKQKKFCDAYLANGGNGTEAVIEAGYNLSRKGKVNKNLAGCIASENLRKPKIQGYFRTQLEAEELTEMEAKKQHLFLIRQFSNLSVKVRALDLFYKITGVYQKSTTESESEARLEELLDRMSNVLNS